jgi:hypothetical protein
MKICPYISHSLAGQHLQTVAELKRPWKLATLLFGIAMLIAGAFIFQAPDWDVPVSLIMAITAYVTAPWCMRVIVERRWRQWPLMVLLTWFAVDGCYWIYWQWKNPLALEWMRAANAPASLSLFWMCGLVWYYQGTAKNLLADVRCLLGIKGG